MKKNKKPGSHRSAEAKYRQTRISARNVLLLELQEVFGHLVRLDDITPTTLTEVEKWERLYSSSNSRSFQPAWKWPEKVKKFRSRPRRIELSIWYDSELCGIALGRISDASVVVTIHFLEGKPATTPLSGHIADIATRFVELVAVALQARQISIENPVFELLDHYKSLGFTHEVKKKGEIIRLVKEC